MGVEGALKDPTVKGLGQSPGTDKRDAEEVCTCEGRDKICAHRKIALSDLYVQFPLSGTIWLGLFGWLCNFCLVVLRGHLTFPLGSPGNAENTIERCLPTFSA